MQQISHLLLLCVNDYFWWPSASLVPNAWRQNKCRSRMCFRTALGIENQTAIHECAQMRIKMVSKHASGIGRLTHRRSYYFAHSTSYSASHNYPNSNIRIFTSRMPYDRALFLRRKMRHILLGSVKNSLCFNMRNCRDIWNTIDGHTQHLTFELPKMTTLHVKKSKVVFKELILI